MPYILRTLFLGTMITCGAISSSYGQGEIPVDMFTGTPRVGVPLWTVTERDISVPIGLLYSANGVRVNESSGPVGIGWSLSAGASVRREVRGLPDDFSGSATEQRQGWILTGNSGLVQSLGNTADLSASTCSDETTDYNAINGLNYSSDTEPDVFSYSAGDVSGQFVIDPSGNVHLIPYRDVQITYVGPMEGNAPITSFTIRTNTGYTYLFDRKLTAKRWTKKREGADAVRYQQRFFEQYDIDRHGAAMSYTEEWKVSRITSPMGGSMTFEYVGFAKTTTTEPVKIGLRQNTSPAVQEFIPYEIHEEHTRSGISWIQGASSGGYVSFGYSGDRLKSIVVRDTRVSSDNVVRNFEFSYKTIGSSYLRYFLSSVREFNGCDGLPPYKFTYIGVNDESAQQGATGSILPPPGSNSIDAWGYYNGKNNTSLFPKTYVYPNESVANRYRLEPIPNYAGTVVALDGADRSVGNYSITIGSLSTITYPSGGSATIMYEPNSYYDEVAQRSFRGGGLRVLYTVYFDGMNQQNNIIKRFTYEEAPGQSSGRLLHRPVFAFPLSAYRDPANQSTIKTYSTLNASGTNALWEHLTARTESDLVSTDLVQGSYVGYKTVQVARTGVGRAQHDFGFPGVAGDDYHETDWIATVNKFVRSTACPSMGVVSGGGRDAFPYSPSPGYTYRRGLPLKKTEYNEAGTKVREVTTAYQPLYKSGTAPFKLWGLYYDAYANGANTFFFGKYYELTDVDYTVSTETVNVYDETNIANVISTATSYYHDSPNHKLLSRVTTTNSDGTVLTTKTRYPQDYVIPNGADKPGEMLVRLLNGYRRDVPIEQISTQQKEGDVEKVVGASVMTFSDFGGNLILPQYTYSLRASAPTASFTPSYIHATTKKFTIDPAYELTNTYLAFDAAGNARSVRGEDRLTTGVHLGYNNTLPVATVQGAMHDQVAFSDFETTTGNEFAPSASIAYGEGRTGARAWYPQGTISRTVQKGDAKQFVFSCWIKKGSGAVNLQLVIRPTATGTPVYNSAVQVTPATTGFEYYERVIDVSTFPASFVVDVQGTIPGSASGFNPDLLPVVDDIAFYPTNAVLSTTTYALPFGPSSVTAADATTVYTSYDKLGRVKLVYDQDRNILQRTSYAFAATPVTLIAGIDLPTNLWAGESIWFSAIGNDCIDGETYSWSLDNVSYTTPSGSKFYSQIFNMPGEYTVWLKVNHGTYGTVTTSANFTVVLPPFTVSICAKGVYRVDNCNGGTIVLQEYSCSSITGSPGILRTIFRATAQTDATIKSYTWYWRPIDDQLVGWSKTVTTQEYLRGLSSPYKSYAVKCVVETMDGRKAESEDYAVFVSCGDVN